MLLSAADAVTNVIADGNVGKDVFKVLALTQGGDDPSHEAIVEEKVDANGLCG